MNDSWNDLRRALAGRYPVVHLITEEEARVVRTLRSWAGRLSPQGPLEVVLWNSSVGLQGGDVPAELDSKDPIVALQSILERPGRCLYIFNDLPPFYDDPRVVRAVRDVGDRLRGQEGVLLITSPRRTLPAELERQIATVEIGLPDVSELGQLVGQVWKAHRKEISEEDNRTVAAALRGLTSQEAGHALQRVAGLKQGLDESIAEIHREKQAAIRRAGYLEMMPPGAALDEIGGLGNLKDWLRRRDRLFSEQAAREGLPVPKGLLVMGMSGCGKSLAAKAVAAFWRVPLFRLDMNLVMSGLYGSPEGAFDRALKAIEALAPAVLWVDEIENSLGMDEGDQGQGDQRIFARFLTWMQEKPPLVFVAATANRISALPAEVIRKGRFDQVFFVDLPGDQDRREILEIHLRRQGANLEDFDLELLSIATKGWNGAEIEQAVASARIDAYSEGRAFTLSDVTRTTSSSVPLSRTMHEQMKKIRSWAFGRAVPAAPPEGETGLFGSDRAETPGS